MKKNISNILVISFFFYLLLNTTAAKQFQPINYQSQINYTDSIIYVRNESGDIWAQEFFSSPIQINNNVYYFKNFSEQPLFNGEYNLTIEVYSSGAWIEDQITANTSSYISRGQVGGRDYGLWVNQDDYDHVFYGYIGDLGLSDSSLDKAYLRNSNGSVLAVDDVVGFDTLAEHSLKTGFPEQNTNPANLYTTLGFDNSTRNFTIEPTTPFTSFHIFDEGFRFDFDGVEYVEIPDEEGLFWFYFDNDTLEYVKNPTVSQEEMLIRTKVLVAQGYWDSLNDKLILMGDERHGSKMSSDTHAYLHFSRGAQWLAGLGLSNVVADGDGDVNESAQFGVGQGVITDEDLINLISAVGSEAGLPIFYMNSSSAYLRRNSNSGFSVLTDVDVGVGSTGRLVWNEFNGTNYILSTVGNIDFVLSHIFATNSKQDPVIAFVGQGDYATIGQARAGATTEISNIITTFPKQELVPLASLIYETWDNHDNDVKARVRSTDEGDPYIDWRTTELTPGSTPSAHPNLATLNWADAGHTLDADLIPESNLSYDFGSEAFRWNALFVNGFDLAGGDVNISKSGATLRVGADSYGVSDGTVNANKWVGYTWEMDNYNNQFSGIYFATGQINFDAAGNQIFDFDGTGGVGSTGQVNFRKPMYMQDNIISGVSNLDADKLALGNNHFLGLGDGDINASEIFYDTLTAKSPIFQCSEDWCSVGFPRFQKTLWIQKDDGWNVLDIVYDGVHYSKSEFRDLVSGTQFEDLSIKLNSKIQRLQSKKQDYYDEVDCLAVDDRFYNGSCYELVNRVVDYDGAVLTFEQDITRVDDYPCTRLNESLHEVFGLCQNHLVIGKKDVFRFRDGCGWDKSSGYSCDVWVEVDL